MRRWLREARRARGLRQKEMAWRCGCSVSHYCNLEAGRRQKRLRLETAEKIAAALWVTVQWVTEQERGR